MIIKNDVKLGQYFVAINALIIVDYNEYESEKYLLNIFNINDNFLPLNRYE